MKMRVGTRLLSARQDRKLTQVEMAELLGVSPATYSRLERNETSIDLEQVTFFAKMLEIPIQEFLPETVSINGQNERGNIGLVMGSIYNYGDDKLAQENEFLKEKIKFLEAENENLKKINALLEKK